MNNVKVRRCLKIKANNEIVFQFEEPAIEIKPRRSDIRGEDSLVLWYNGYHRVGEGYLLKDRFSLIYCRISSFCLFTPQDRKTFTKRRILYYIYFDDKDNRFSGTQLIFRLLLLIRGGLS
jgi:hypothetical protein